MLGKSTGVCTEMRTLHQAKIHFKSILLGRLGVELVVASKAALKGLAVGDLAVEIKAWCGTVNAK